MRDKVVYTLGALGALLMVWNVHTIFLRDAGRGDAGADRQDAVHSRACRDYSV